MIIDHSPGCRDDAVVVRDVAVVGAIVVDLVVALLAVAVVSSCNSYSRK